jgi:hypothetical protein
VPVSGGLNREVPESWQLPANVLPGPPARACGSAAAVADSIKRALVSEMTSAARSMILPVVAWLLRWQ